MNTKTELGEVNRQSGNFCANYLLREYALAPLGKVNRRAWEFFVQRAEADKVWAENATGEFLSASCDVTRKMAEKYRQTPTLVLAAQHYGYSYYRGHSRMGIHWVDPSARKLWAGFEAAEAIREITGE